MHDQFFWKKKKRKPKYRDIVGVSLIRKKLLYIDIIYIILAETLILLIEAKLVNYT